MHYGILVVAQWERDGVKISDPEEIENLNALHAAQFKEGVRRCGVRRKEWGDVVCDGEVHCMQVDGAQWVTQGS